MKKRKSIKPRSALQANRTRFVWDFNHPPHHPSAPPVRHFFQGDSLARSLEIAIARGDTLLYPDRTRGVAPANVQAVSGEIVAENSYAIEVHLEFRGAARKSHRLRLVVARNDQELGQMLKTESRNLTALATRLPKILAPPLAGGLLFLPDRHRRTGQNRRIPAFATRPIPESLYCGIGGPEQLIAYSASPRLLGRDATDKIKSRVIEICLRSFDPRARTAMPPPDIQRGTMRLSSRAGASGEIVIAGCPFLWDHLDHVGLLHRLTGFDWKEGDRAMPLLPGDHSLLRESMVAALGKSTARVWTKEYAAALDQGRYKPHHRFSRDSVTDLHESLAP